MLINFVQFLIKKSSKNDHLGVAKIKLPSVGSSKTGRVRPGLAWERKALRDESEEKQAALREGADERGRASVFRHCNAKLERGGFVLLCFALLCLPLLCFAFLCFHTMLCFTLLCFPQVCFAFLCFALLCSALLCVALLKASSRA